MKNEKLKIKLSVLIIIGLMLPSFAFLQTQPIAPPENLEGAKKMGEKALETTQKELPGILEKIWKEEVLPIWQKMYDWFKVNIWPKIESLFKTKIQPQITKEVEKRKPIIGEEFQKEKKEMKESVPTTKTTVLNLWEKFKELIK